MKNQRVSQSQIAEVVGTAIGENPKRTGMFIDKLFKAVYEYTKLGYDVQFMGFGTFSFTERTEREGVHPRKPTERIIIPAHKVPKFVAGEEFKRVINGKE